MFLLDAHFYDSVKDLTFFQDQVDKCEQNIEDHEGYIAKYKDCTEWIKSQEMALGDCTDTPRDNEALEEKLETIKVRVTHLWLVDCSVCLFRHVHFQFYGCQVYLY